MLETNVEHTHLVIPRWLSLPGSIGSGELSAMGAPRFQLDASTMQRLAEHYADFKKSPNVHHASELMGDAILLDDQNLASTLANYVLEHGGIAEPSVVLARRVLQKPNEASAPISVQHEIARNKRKLTQYPRDPLVWMESARLYTIKGQLDKARRAVLVALAMAPCDRYIVRSAARFFIHAGELDSAWHHVSIAARATQDPWVRATLVSLAVLLERDAPKDIRSVPRQLNSDGIFHYSELIESVGMLHLLSGQASQAKKSFKRAWLNPSDNVIAHGEWIIRDRFPKIRGAEHVEFERSLQAMTWRSYSELDLGRALEWVREWELEEPYSASPYMMGSALACQHGNPQEGAEFARRGLIANPNHFILTNNLCFALLRDGDVRQAQIVFSALPSDPIGVHKVLWLATGGLLRYQQGNNDQGRDSYQQAAAEAIRIGQPLLAVNARLHLALAEIEYNADPSMNIIAEALHESERREQPNILLVRQQLLNRLERQRH